MIGKSRFVIDCSVTMAWCFEDESNSYADKILERLATDEAIVPSLWPLEVGNVLLVGERRKRLTQADVGRFVTLLGALHITIDRETPDHAFTQTLVLGHNHNLSMYDASYVELAIRHGLPIATLDKRLKAALPLLGIPTA